MYWRGHEAETVVVTLQDMTSLNELEKMRAEFLGMVSHELRAPLTSIKGSVDTLLESFNSLDSAEMVQFLRIIKSQSDRMRDLISDLLDVARIETGMLSVHSRSGGGGGSGGRGDEHLPDRGRPEKLHYRHGAGPALGDGGPAAHRPGPGQPIMFTPPPRFLAPASRG